MTLWKVGNTGFGDFHVFSEGLYKDLLHEEYQSFYILDSIVLSLSQVTEYFILLITPIWGCFPLCVYKEIRKYGLKAAIPSEY